MQGPSGIGRSTFYFARELCHEWNTTPTLRDNFDIVLLIKLRNKLVQNAKKLSQLFIHHDENLSERVVSEIENGDRVLLIFDGFDEYPNSESSSSLIDNIMKGVYLPSATLLVTSLAIAKEWFKKLRCNNNNLMEIEILGFTETNRMEFVENVFGSNTLLLQRFKTYCSKNPAIMSMMYIPLNCAIIMQIYKEYWEHDDLLPKTMTQLYTSLCWTLIRQYVIQKGILYDDLSPGNFSNLPSDVLHSLSQLAQLAYEKLKYDKLVFTIPDKDNFEHMGFMTVSEETLITSGTHCTYNFLHLSIQEYLAAWHICQMGDKCELMNNISLRFYDVGELAIIENEEICSDHYSDSDNCDYDVDACGLDILRTFIQNIGAFIYGFLHEQLKYDMISAAITYLSSYSFPQGPLTLMQYLFEAQSTALCHKILKLILKRIPRYAVASG